MKKTEGKALSGAPGGNAAALVTPAYSQQMFAAKREPGDLCPKCGKPMTKVGANGPTCRTHGAPSGKSFEELVNTKLTLLRDQMKGAVSHTHAKSGGGTTTHRHNEAIPGHEHEGLLPTLKAKDATILLMDSPPMTIMEAARHRLQEKAMGEEPKCPKCSKTDLTPIKGGKARCQNCGWRGPMPDEDNDNDATEGPEPTGKAAGICPECNAKMQGSQCPHCGFEEKGNGKAAPDPTDAAGAGRAGADADEQVVKCPQCGHEVVPQDMRDADGVDDVCPFCGHVFEEDATDEHETSPDNDAGLGSGSDMPRKNIAIPNTKLVQGFSVDWGYKTSVAKNGTLILKGYGNTWAEDRDGETTAKKAFDDSLGEFMTNPVVLLNHDADKPIGVITKASPDTVGLYVEAEIPKPDAGSEPWHIKAYKDIKDGVLKTFSMGGVFIRSKDVRGLIEKVKLYEVSVVTIPANPTSVFRVAAEKGLDGWETKSHKAFSPISAGALATAHSNPARTRGKEVPSMDDESNKEPVAGTAAGGSLEGQTIAVMAERLEALEAEKKQLDMEKAAEAEAMRRLEAEQEAAAERKSQEDAQRKAVDEMVEQKLAAFRSGKKFEFTGTAAPGQINRDSADEGKSLGDWLRLLVRKKNGDYTAFQRLEEMNTKAAEAYGIKALSGTTSGAGGFLVPPQYWQAGIAEFRIAAAKVRSMVQVITTNSNLVYIPRETGISAVGWTAENATKPSTDQTFSQIAVTLYTLAGIAKVSNQLLEDSSPAVDQIVRKDLGRGLGQAEDIAFINGDGNQKPTGILNTTGIQTGAIGASKLADALATAITAIQSNYYGDPTAILAHPREVNVLRLAKDANGRYIFEPAFFQGADPRMGGMGSFLGATQLGGGFSDYPNPAAQAVGTVWGLPVVADANMPTTLGAGTNESPVIVGNFEEAYVIERMGVTIDVSNEAGTSFESNQTFFRGEERIGFTAARQPLAFYSIAGLTPTAG